MRLRNIRGSEEILEASSFVIQAPSSYKGRWSEVFGNNNPIHIEIGMGKGKFIMKHAMKNPHINYVGIERYSSVLLRAVQKRQEESQDIKNLCYLCMDARELPEVFAATEIDRIYLNFSDPWPKDRHAKRRLTSTFFMKLYDQVLSLDGWIEFKTDNRGLFEFSLESIPEAGWSVKEYTFDLHHNSMVEGNIMTEYETKFASEGKPICKLIAVR